MAYLGSTEASSLINQVRNFAGPFAAQPSTTSFSTANPTDGGASPYRVSGGGFFVYVSSHGTTEIMADDFFGDHNDAGAPVGMKPLDVLIHVSKPTSGTTTILSVHVVESVSTAGVTLEAGDNSYLSTTRASSI